MYFYIKGKVTYINTSYIVVDNNNVGYLIYVSNPYSYRLNDDVTVYIYQQIREDENTLYGFNSLEYKELFLKLIGVKGLGPKMALPILSSNLDNIYEAIEKGDISYLKKFPKIGDKVARQIILDLKGKLQVDDKNNNYDYTELTESLKSLGYKPADIKRILPSIDVSKKINDQIKEALKLLLK